MSISSLTRLALTAGVIFVSTATSPAASLTKEQAAEARRLVRQLGAADYRQREAAGMALIKMGAAVEPVLREAMEWDDPEIRFRCRTILPLALNYDLDRRLNAFLAGKDDAAPAMWPRFKELVGDSPASRELFASMHRFDSEFLLGLEKDPASQRQRMTLSCIEFAQSRNTGYNAPINIEQVALILFATQVDKLKVEPEAQSNLSGALLSASFQARGKEVLRGNEQIRKLLVKYLSEVTIYTAHNAMYLIANLELKEGVNIARAYLKQDSRDSYTRGMALSILGKIGTKELIPEIMPYLEDKTPMGETQIGNHPRIRTQFRDVALATLVQLSGQSLFDYDFAYLKQFPARNVGLNLHLSPSLFGFHDDKAREASLKKWKDWYAKNQETPAKK